MKYKGLFQYEPKAQEHHCYVIRIYYVIKLERWFATVAKDAIRTATLGPFETEEMATIHAMNYEHTREKPTVRKGKGAREDSHDIGGRTGGESDSE